MQGADRVVVAADSEEIAEVVRSWGGEAILTDSELPSGTLRIHALLDQLDADFLLNVQGDEPFIEPALLEQLLAEAARTGCDIITAVNPIQDSDDLFNPNIVKALRAADGRALYFTRNACPHVRDHERIEWLHQTTFYRHIGVYGYTPKALRWYADQPPSPLEQVEKLEQLRFIEHGWHFQTVETPDSPTGIDTPEDLARAECSLKTDKPKTSKLRSRSAQHYEIARDVVYREIDSLQHVLVRNREAIPRVVDLLQQASGKIVVTGLGKSGLIGRKIAATFASTGSPAVFLNAAEALHGDLGMVGAGDLVLMISNSAATDELRTMLASLQRIGARCIGLFGRTDTPLAAEMEVVLDISAPREACPLNLAPMSTTTNTLVIGDALAAALMQARGFTPDHFALYHPGGNLGRRLLLRVRDVMHTGPADTPEVAPDTPLCEALKQMSAVNLGGIVITEQKRILGVFTDGDLRRRIVEGCALDQPIATVMTRDPITVAASMRLGEVLDLMEGTTRKIYFVPVSDENGLLCGALRMHDVVAS